VRPLATQCIDDVFELHVHLGLREPFVQKDLFQFFQESQPQLFLPLPQLRRGKRWMVQGYCFRVEVENHKDTVPFLTEHVRIANEKYGLTPSIESIRAVLANASMFTIIIENNQGNIVAKYV
jgi:hypothetical protein